MKENNKLATIKNKNKQTNNKITPINKQIIFFNLKIIDKKI